MKKMRLQEKLHNYRFEWLLVALLLVLFNKAFVPDESFYTRVIWPVNMILLGFSSWGIFREKIGWVRWFRNLLFLMSVLIPVTFGFIARSSLLMQAAFLVYVLYYGIIFLEVLRQIFQRTEATVSVIMGSICGFLLLIVIAQFSFLHMAFTHPDSFNGLKPGSVPALYNQLSYFSMVTLATVGYGDITPASESARLITMFFAISAQFYMVALVGIIVSRFAPKSA